MGMMGMDGKNGSDSPIPPILPTIPIVPILARGLRHNAHDFEQLDERELGNLTVTSEEGPSMMICTVPPLSTPSKPHSNVLLNPMFPNSASCHVTATTQRSYFELSVEMATLPVLTVDLSPSPSARFANVRMSFE